MCYTETTTKALRIKLESILHLLYSYDKKLRLSYKSDYVEVYLEKDIFIVDRKDKRRNLLDTMKIYNITNLYNTLTEYFGIDTKHILVCINYSLCQLPINDEMRKSFWRTTSHINSDKNSGVVNNSLNDLELIRKELCEKMLELTNIINQLENFY